MGFETSRLDIVKNGHYYKQITYFSIHTDSKTKRETGRQAQLSNIAAARAVADIIRTTLGPRSMLKVSKDLICCHLQNEHDTKITTSKCELLVTISFSESSSRMEERYNMHNIPRHFHALVETLFDLRKKSMPRHD